MSTYEILQKDPLEITKEDLDEIIRELRAKRTMFSEKPAAPASKPKTSDNPTFTLDL